MNSRTQVVWEGLTGKPSSVARVGLGQVLLHIWPPDGARDLVWNLWGFSLCG